MTLCVQCLLKTDGLITAMVFEVIQSSLKTLYRLAQQRLNLGFAGATHREKHPFKLASSTVC